MPKRSRLTWQILFWRILKRSPVFRYWYRKHLNELLFDLELHRDIEQVEVEAKYRDKLARFS